MTSLSWVMTAALLAAGEPAQQDWDWLSEHRAAAFESLMPVERVPQAYVTYRSYRDLYQDVPERYFAIHGPIGSLEATVVIPETGSVQQQLLDMHIADRAASFDSLLHRVRVRRLRLAASRCPAIKVQLDRLAVLKAPPPTRDIIVLHPVVHRILIDFGGGRMDASLNEDQHPLATWALQALTALQRCQEPR